MNNFVKVFFHFHMDFKDYTLFPFFVVKSLKVFINQNEITGGIYIFLE